MTAPSLPPRERPRVLLVDDERGILDALRPLLETEFEVDTAISSEEAQLYLAARAYDVVVADHLLEGPTGLDLLILARDRHPRTQRILITGYTNPELISRSVSVAELSACLLKPLHGEEISAAIWAALGRK